MVERPPSSKIQKTTSRIALMGLAAATMMITVGMIGAIQMQEASAAKPLFCYDSGSTTEPQCFPTMNGEGSCQDRQGNDPAAESRCYPFRPS